MKVPYSEDKVLLGLEMLNRLNDRGCPACGKKFSLGDTVVTACGYWGEGRRFVHENEAVYDAGSGCWFERGFHQARRGSAPGP